MDAVTWGLVISVFVACVVEAVEATTIVLAMGFTRGWRSAIAGTLVALVALAAFTLVAGFALVNWLPESALQLVIGTLLLIFGLQWLRKAIYRSSGRKAMHDEEAIYAEEVAVAQRAGETSSGLDMFGFMVSFKGVFLEGLEVVFIVLTFGLSANNVPAAVYGAAAAIVLVLIAAVLIRKPLSMVPENTLKFGVGLLLTSFGMFWSIEGLGIFRDGHHSLDFPGGDLAVLYFLASVSLLCAVLMRILRLPARPAAIVDNAGDAAAGEATPTTATEVGS
jgi:Ca2+/H+ antiporter, TMEM165/GDT1 family